MITKERLKELKEHNKEIWVVNRIDKYIFETNISNPDYWYDRDIYDRIFETRAEAEHYLKYGNMTRTETLSLPYEIAENAVGERLKFMLAGYNYWLFKYKDKFILEKGGIGFCEEQWEFDTYAAACAKVKELWEGGK